MNDRLGLSAIDASYGGYPIRVEDEIDWDACHFATAVYEERNTNNTIYGNKIYLLDQMREVYAKEFNLSENTTHSMNFYDAYLLSDVIISEQFEGIKTHLDFTEE